MKVHFRATLLNGHKCAAVEVPFDPAQRWGTVVKTLWPGRRGHAVGGSLEGVRFESCIVARSKRFFVLVDSALQQSAGVALGERVSVTLEPLSPEAASAFAEPSRRAHKRGA